METFSAHPQKPTKRKNKFQLFLLLGLIVILALIVILDVLSFMGKIDLKKDTLSSSIETLKNQTTDQTEETNSKLNLAGCIKEFSKTMLFPTEFGDYSGGFTSKSSSGEPFKKPNDTTEKPPLAYTTYEGLYFKGENESFDVGRFDISLDIKQFTEKAFEENHQGKQFFDNYEDIQIQAIKEEAKKTSKNPQKYIEEFESRFTELDLYGSKVKMEGDTFLLTLVPEKRILISIGGKNVEVFFNKWASKVCGQL